MEPRPVTQEDLQRTRQALDVAAQSGQLEDAFYFKGLVALATAYANIGDVPEAFRILCVPDDNYYKLIQPLQMDEDTEYQEAVVTLIARLQEAGLIEAVPDLIATQKGATA